MAQHDYIISNATFPAVRTDINNALSAIQTTNSGTSRPTGAVAGQLWLDTTSATTPTLKYYDGADDISLATIDHVGNTVNWLDSTVSITGLSTTATGTVLTLSDSVNTTTVNLIIDNQKEIRFRETTANGTNYVALKAPASVASDLTFTLPATDGASGQALVTNGSGVLSFASAGLAWQSVQTTGFTASAGRGYFCNTTSSAFTVTLPSGTPTLGDQIALIDYAGTFDTNALTINPNGNKIEGSTLNVILTGEREGVLLTYSDSTQGWLVTSAVNEGTDALSLAPYTISYLTVAGGGGGRTNLGGGGGAGGYLTSTTTINPLTVYTITVGAGGTQANSGTNSSITGLTASVGGGAGGIGVGVSGGSGGGGGYSTGSTSPGSNAGGAGTSGQGNAGGSSQFNGPGSYADGGGGGGANAVGGNGTTSGNGTGGAGGAGLASSITGSSVTRAGGGGGGGVDAGGAGGTGGGGAGGTGGGATGTAGTANTGGGGGGGGSAGGVGASGGSGVVILSIPTANYSSTTTGSPSVSTSGSNTILVYNSSGSYTG